MPVLVFCPFAEIYQKYFPIVSLFILNLFLILANHI